MRKSMNPPPLKKTCKKPMSFSKPKQPSPKQPDPAAFSAPHGQAQKLTGGFSGSLVIRVRHSSPVRREAFPARSVGGGHHRRSRGGLEGLPNSWKSRQQLEVSDLAGSLRKTLPAAGSLHVRPCQTRLHWDGWFQASMLVSVSSCLGQKSLIMVVQ